MADQIPAEVLEVLAKASTDGPQLTLTGQLDRRLYTAVDRVLVKAGGRWDRRARAHVFPGDAVTVLVELLDTGQVANEKAEHGIFYTPAPVADRLASWAVRPGDLVLEPSCGSGALVVAALRAGAASVQGYDVRDVDSEMTEALVRHVEGVPHSEPLGSPIRWNRCADALAAVSVRWRQVDFLSLGVGADFLTDEGGRLYDAVVMNPPFAGQADTIHVTHALTHLRPGGRLAAVMSPGWTFRQTIAAARLRELRDGTTVAESAWEPLTDGTFRGAGTDVRTGILTVELAEGDRRG